MDLTDFLGQYGFEMLDMPMLQNLYSEGISDANISQVMRMKLNHVFVNKMMFSLNGAEHPKSDRLRESWEDELRVVMRHVWCCGFGATVTRAEAVRVRTLQAIIQGSPSLDEAWKKIKKRFGVSPIDKHKDFVSDLNFLQEWVPIGAEPETGLWIDENTNSNAHEGYAEAIFLTELLVFVKRGWSSVEKFLYVLPVRMSNGQTCYVRICNVFTLKDEGSRGPGHQIVSRVHQLMPALELERKTRACYETSIATRAAPSIPLEADDKKPSDDDSEQRAHLLREINNTELQPRPARMNAERENDSIDVLVRTERTLRTYQEEKDPKVPSQAYTVPKGLKVGKQAEAHEPTYFKEVTAMRLAEIWGVMEVPQSLMALYSLHLEKTQRTIGQVGGKTLSIDSLPYRLFQEANDRQASIFTSYVNQIIGYSTIKRVSLEVAQAMNEDDDVTNGIDVDSNVLQVMMPKNPDADKILSLMASGILKYKAGIQLMAKVMAISIDCFNEAEPKDLNQLVGIKHEEQAKQPPAKKRR